MEEAMARISPADINSRMFKITFRGFDTKEVENFLGLIADEVETLSAENSMLRDKVAALEKEVAGLKEEEEKVRRRMEEATAYRNKMVSEARYAADDIIKSAQARANQLESIVNMMKEEKHSLETYFRSFLRFNVELLKIWEREEED
jgi:cell division initiation protein